MQGMAIVWLARHRLGATDKATSLIDALSGRSNLATVLSSNFGSYRATAYSCYRPIFLNENRATTILDNGNTLPKKIFF